MLNVAISLSDEISEFVGIYKSPVSPETSPNVSCLKCNNALPTLNPPKSAHVLLQTHGLCLETYGISLRVILIGLDKGVAGGGLQSP